MKSHSFYKLADGQFTGRIITCVDEALDANTEAGESALEGRFDCLSQRVRMPTNAGDQPVVENYIPAAPADGDLMVWAWDAYSKRWVSAPTQYAVAQAARAERDRLLNECDWVVSRAFESGAAVPTDWAAYRTALRNLPAQTGFPSVITWPVPPTT